MPKGTPNHTSWRCRHERPDGADEMDVDQSRTDVATTIADAQTVAADAFNVPPKAVKCWDMVTITGRRAYTKARSKTKHHCVGCGRTVAEKDFVKRSSMCVRCHVRSGG